MAELNLLFTDRSLNLYGSARIVLEGSYSRDKNDNILLTPDCATFEELNHYIDGLVGNLERARKGGKIAFEKAKTRPRPSPFK